jgi:hypothetical protein
MLFEGDGEKRFGVTVENPGLLGLDETRQKLPLA